MAEGEPNSKQTLAVLFGASSYRRAPKLAQGRAFYNSAQDFHDYLISSDGLGLASENINWLFDDTRSSTDQLQDIGDFLETRSLRLRNEGAEPKDLVLYYVGHGLFWGPDHTYSFAIRVTNEESEGLTSIRASDLASIIKAHARFLRKFLILDCCFSAAAYKEFQSGPLMVSRVKLMDELPQRGTTLLCSASAHEPSLSPAGLTRTMFSDCLLKTLNRGHASLGSRLSLCEIGDLIKLQIREDFPDIGVRPEIHSPDQREGDIAHIPVFPNRAYWEAQQKAEAEKARLEAGARKNIEAERAIFHTQNAIPKKIGKYQVLDILGRGGMGVVYKAVDPTINRLVAIKVLLTDFDNQEMLKRFYSEAQSTGRLQHPNIVTLYELGDEAGTPYLVMQFLAGESLDKVISSSRQLTLIDMLGVVVQVCSGLQHAHSHGIIHRDVKPANVVLLPDSSVKLVDFGIAKFGNERQTRTGLVIGSIKYMSPEQIGGASIDVRSDVYSTGVLLYELLTRRLPFEGSDIGSTIHKILNSSIPAISDSIPNAPPKLDRILRNALAKNPEDRYQTAEDFAFDLRQLQKNLQENLLLQYIAAAKESLLARDWPLASDQLKLASAIDKQHQEVHDLNLELRIMTGTQPIPDRIQALMDLSRDAYQQGRIRDLLRLCSLGLDLDNTHSQLLALRDAAQKLLSPEISPAVCLEPTPPTSDTPMAETPPAQPAAAPSVSLPDKMKASVPAISEPVQTDKDHTDSDKSKFQPRHLKRMLVAAVSVLCTLVLIAVVWKHHNSGQQLSSSGPKTQSQTSSPSSQTPVSNNQKVSEPENVAPESSVKPVPAPSAQDEKASKQPIIKGLPNSEEDDWRKAEQANTVDAMDRYLQQHPNSSFKSLAVAKREDLVWERSRAAGTSVALNAYLEAYPAGRYAQRAKDELVNLDSKTIDTATDPQMLESFLIKYPVGDIHNRALNRLDDLAWAQTDKDSARLNTYLQKFPNGRHSTEARAQLANSKTAPIASTETHPVMPATSSVAAPSLSLDDKAAIMAALVSYQQAYDRQDIAGIQQVWPTMSSQQKRSTVDLFNQVQSVRMTYDILSGPDITGTDATLRLSQTVVFSTGGAPKSRAAKVLVSLKKGSQGQWYIDSIR
jgi:serine/threonine protein kinase